MYTLTSSTAIIRDSDGATIPADQGNLDYRAYQLWLAAGNAPTPAPVITVDPKATIFNAALAAGYDTGLGWRLPLDDAARSLITSGAALITSAIIGYQLAANTAAITAFMGSSYTFTDTTNAVQTVTIAQALSINIGYGSYYKTIWSAAQ